jgi:regulatory protein
MAESLLFKTALSKAMALCSRREYCISEIREKVVSWGISDSDSDKIIATLIQENFINEERYATAFVKDKFNYNKWGKIKISAHLKAKRIQSVTIKIALESIDDDVYIKTITSVLESHRRSVKAKNKYDLKAKMLRYGLSKGFESSILYDILNVSEE